MGLKAKILGNLSPLGFKQKNFDLKKVKKNQDGNYLIY
jgi:hypothetical protein